MRYLLLTSLALLSFLTGCATTPPEQLAGNDFAPITPSMAQTDPTTVGQKVRWGGRIAEVLPSKNDTCFEVVEHELDSSGRPLDDDRSGGRFMACAQGFFEPEIYAPKRAITVTGVLLPTRMGKVGDRDYAFPRVAASVVYLWPKQQPLPQGPYWGMYPYGDPWMMDSWMGPGWVGMPW